MKRIRRNLSAFAVAAAVLGAAGCELRNRSEGDSCACSNQCGEGLYCTEHAQPSEVDGTCGEGSGVCTAYADKGAACSQEGAGSPKCEPPLICRPFDHVCSDRLAAGERCDPQLSYQCATGLSCNVALEPAQCRAPGKVGEPCAMSGDCASPLVCNVGFDPGRCEPLGSSAEGEPCSNDDNCASGLVCNTGVDAPVCIAIGSLAMGADCNQDVQCASHHCITWSGTTSGYWIGKCS